MSVSTSRTRLVSSLKELLGRWDRVRAQWDDPVRREFEAEFIAPLDGKVRSGVSAMERMQELLDRARKECA
jgi:hypothetical protein